MCCGNLSPMASRTSTSDSPTTSLAAANPTTSGTVSKSHTMTVGFISYDTLVHIAECASALKAVFATSFAAYGLRPDHPNHARLRQPTAQPIRRTNYSSSLNLHAVAYI